MRKIKSIHFVGLKGVGMTPLAIIAKEAGMKVTGSDIKEEFITDISLKNAGIAPFIGFSKENVKDADLVIATGAHGGLKNIEVLEAKKRGIPVWTQGQAVGEYMRGNLFKREFIGISVAGSHGKTTTTAMIATILAENNLDASFLIGTGSVPSLGAPGHFGKGKYFVAEADEYATEPESDLTPKFLWQNPKIEVFTNIEFDHPDIYKSVDEIREDFLRFANKIPKDGILIAGVEVGLSLQNIKKAIGKYNGSKRRFEFIGRLKTGAKVFDDYAHHPTEIKKTLAAIRKNNSKSKIVCIFQPHTYSRTKALFSDFVTSFYDADTVILMTIYPSLREEKDPTVSSELLVQKISQTHKDALFLPDESSVVKYIDQKKYSENTIIITMGAGDVYKISEKLDL